MLENENVNAVETPEVDYIKAIEDLKASTVSKDLYDKLRNENKRLIDTVVSGGTIEVASEPKPDIGQLRRELYGYDSLTAPSLDVAVKTLKLREALMAEGQPDPFAPQGKNIVATDEDRATAQKVADGFQHCIDVANGDPLVFANELQRITVDIAPIRRK